MNTKKSIYLIVISVIAVAAIIFGTFRFTRNLSFGSIRNWFNNEIDYDDWDDYDDDDFDEDDNVRKSPKIDGVITKSFEEITEIKVQASIMSVEIEEGDNFAIECTYNREYLKPVINYDGGVLSVAQKSLKNTVGSNNAKTTIYIPRFNKLDEVNLKVNVGEIEISDVVGDELSIKSNVGQIELDDASFEKISIKANVGEIIVEMTDPVTEYSLDLETNIGDIIVDGKTTKKKYTSRGATYKKMEAKTNVGEIRIE